MKSLEKELEKLLNSFSAENRSSTPDFILARYLMHCLEAYNLTVLARDKWFGIDNMFDYMHELDQPLKEQER